MTGLQSDTPNNQPVSTNVQEDAHFEDEINLMDYFWVLWKHKSLVLLGSIMPTLIVGLILLLGTRNYKATYIYDVKDQSVYDVKYQSAYEVEEQSFYDTQNRSVSNVSNWNLNENKYKILLDRFYSAENTNKIKTKLQEYNPETVTFEVWPPYTDLSKTKITNAAELEKIRRLEAQLLKMTIVARPKNDISKISLVIRDNLENAIPVFVVEEHLNVEIREFRNRMIGIDKNRFDMGLALKTNKSILAKLKNIKPPVSDRNAGNISLQFDISGKTEYLPVEYQIQATESKTTQVEEQIAANEEKYNYYKDLLALNEKLLAGLKKSISSYYTIQQYHSFLVKLIGDYEAEELKDYLASYIKRIENRISTSSPVTENPTISSIAKGTVKKSSIVFAVSLMISVFAAFLLEGLSKRPAQVS